MCMLRSPFFTSSLLVLPISKLSHECSFCRDRTNVSLVVDGNFSCSSDYCVHLLYCRDRYIAKERHRHDTTWWSETSPNTDQ